MYESHFGFSGSPFQLNPDPEFYFNSKGHSRAMGYLQYGVMQGEGFIVITGEIGAGKTTLLRTLLEGLDRQKVLAAQIVSTQLESGELLQAIITAFGIPAQGTSKAHLIATLEAFLTALAAQGRHALLIVDEAQNLNEKAVEELRMLSNFQLGNHALLQSFLVGQPELRRLLESPQLEQLRQRVIASQHLGPLGPDETQAYVEHRLRRVGWTDRPAFAPGAFDHVYAWSGGVPRRINRLANRLLLAAYLENADLITPALVEQTAMELRTEIGESSYQPLPLPVRTSPAEDGAATTTEAPAPPKDAPETADAPPVVTEPQGSDAEVRDESGPTVVTSEAPPEVESRDAGSGEVSIDPISTDSEESAAAAVATATNGGGRVSADVVEAGPSVPEVAEQVAAAVAVAARSVPTLQLPARGPSAAQSVRRDVVLCLADSETAALTFAALSNHLPGGASGLRVVLLNPGDANQAWPWDSMTRVLPRFEVGLHLGASRGPYASEAPRLITGMAQAMESLQPVAVVVLGSSDALLTCAMTACKQGVPLVQLAAGGLTDRSAEALNAALIARMADLLLLADEGGALLRLQRQGIDASRCRTVAGRLNVDGLAAIWPEVTTPYGAFMRHAMPIYLGPTWSEHAGEGTPYAVASLTLDSGCPERLRQRVDQVVALSTSLKSLPKCLWLMDEASAAALQGVLDAAPELAGKVCLIAGDGPRAPQDRDRMNSIPLLVRVVGSLTDQLSILRGASAAVVQSGQVLADVAQWLGLPTLCYGADEPVYALDKRVRTMLSEQPPADHSRQNLDLPAGAAEDLAARLQTWLADRNG